ncbi:MAG: MFS transporter [Chloroflexota bacterium]
MQETQANQLNLRQLLPVLFIVFIDTMGFTIVMPVIPFYVLAFDAPPSAVGLIIMFYALAQLLFAPILGNLSDRFGRKPILVISQIGTFASLLLMGFAWTLPMLFLARILDGITGANLSTVQSAISDRTTEADRAKGLGLIGAAAGLGFVVGPLIGGLALRLADNSYSAPAFVGAGFAFVSILLTAFVFRETLATELRGTAKRARSGLGQVVAGLRSPQMGPLYVLIFAVQFIFTMFTASFALFTLNRIGFNSFNNAIFFGVFGVMLVLMQGVFVGRWVPRYGEYRLLVVSFILAFAGFGVASFTPQQAVPWYSEAAMIAELSQQDGAVQQRTLLPSEVGAGIGSFLMILIGLTPGPLAFTLQMPILNTLISKRSAPSEIGQAMGVSAAAAGAGSVVGPLLSGWLFDQVTPFAPFALNSLLSLALLAVVVSLRSTIERPTQSVQDALPNELPQMSAPTLHKATTAAGN